VLDCTSAKEVPGRASLGLFFLCRRALHTVLNGRSRRLKALELLHASHGLTRKQTDKSSLCKVTLDDFERP
jgi:hypothetical protein